MTLDIKSGGCESENVPACNMNHSLFYLRKADRLPLSYARSEQLCLADKYCKEGLRINTKIDGSTHLLTLLAISSLSEIANAPSNSH